MLDPWICLTVKVVKASITVSSVSYKSCTLLWYVKREKYLHIINMFIFKKYFSPGSRKLGAQIRCAQSRYTAVQMNLKYPLLTDIKVTLLRCGF